MMKKCKKCSKEKEIPEFENGRTQCKECRKNYRQERYKNNTEIFNIKRKEYYQKNKEKEKENRKVYYQNNKEKEADYQRKHFKDDPNSVRDSQRKWNQKNPSNKKNRNRRYYQKNKPKLQEKQKTYIKTRKEKDPLFKLTITMRSRIGEYIKSRGYKKNQRTEKIIGCTFEELKSYLESKFESWMNWDNYGMYNGKLNFGWDIDHIIPLSASESEEKILELNRFENLQPLCSKINRDIKKDKIDYIV